MYKYIIVFIAMTLLDYVWAKYTINTSKRNASLSAFWASLIILLTGFVTTNYVADHTLLIPACIGAFIGTYVSVKFHK